jgi:hypothetical protein
MIESPWSTLQREFLDTRNWDPPEQLGSAILEWIEAWYSPRSRHTSLRMLSRVAYEQQWRHSGRPIPSQGRQRRGMITTPPVCVKPGEAPTRQWRTISV